MEIRDDLSEAVGPGTAAPAGPAPGARYALRGIISHLGARHSPPHTLRPAPCALRPAPCALHPAPPHPALRPAPCALRPAPCALPLHPPPLHPPPFPSRRAESEPRALHGCGVQRRDGRVGARERYRGARGAQQRRLQRAAAGGWLPPILRALRRMRRGGRRDAAGEGRSRAVPLGSGRVSNRHRFTVSRQMFAN